MTGRVLATPSALVHSIQSYFVPGGSLGHCVGPFGYRLIIFLVTNRQLTYLSNRPSYAARAFFTCVCGQVITTMLAVCVCGAVKVVGMISMIEVSEQLELVSPQSQLDSRHYLLVIRSRVQDESR